MAPADSGIDPRYAAQFQRGYDPTRDAAPVRRGPVRLEGGPPPTAPRVPDPPRMAPQTSPVAATVDLPEPEAVSPDRGWREWLLPLVGGVLLLAAIAVFWDAATDVRMYHGEVDAAYYSYVTVRAGLPGPLLVGATLAVTSWLFLRAVRGRSAR